MIFLSFRKCHFEEKFRHGADPELCFGSVRADQKLPFVEIPFFSLELLLPVPVFVSGFVYFYFSEFPDELIVLSVGILASECVWRVCLCVAPTRARVIHLLSHASLS